VACISTTTPPEKGIPFFERGDGLDARTGCDGFRPFEQRSTGITGFPSIVPVSTLGTADGSGSDFARRRNRRFFTVEYRGFGQGDVRSHLLERHVVDPEVTRRHHSEGRACLLLLLDLSHVGEPGPAECAILLELNVLSVEHELGRRVIGARGDIEPSQISGHTIPSRFELPSLAHPNLGSGAADQQTRMLARAGDLTDSELAISFVFPTSPPGEDQSELVLLLRNFKRRVCQQVPQLISSGKTARNNESHHKARRLD
jgi:hypothetical protein